MLALFAPLTAILLGAMVDTDNPNELALIVESTLVGFLVGAVVKELMARHAAPVGRPAAAAPAWDRD